MGKKSNLEIDVEDYADLKCLHTLDGHNFIVKTKLDFIRKKEKRECKILFQNGEINWDLKSDKLEIRNNKKIIKRLKSNISRNTLFKKQLEQFNENINLGKTPLSNLENGISSLEVVMLAKKSSKLKKTIYCQ